VILSDGVFVKGTQSVIWQGSPSTWPGWPQNLALGNRWASYSEIYRKQLWVRVCVDKRAMLLARLPLKVYERDELNRPEVPEHPYARLLNRPNNRHSAFFFWQWMQSTYDIYGDAFAGKIRDSGGRPYMLAPMHPTSMRPVEEKDGRTIWDFDNGKVRITGIPDEDLLHLRTYNPDSFTLGLSKLESLRATLENEDAALRAQSSFWRNGARPGVVLSHPNQISKPAADRLKLSWTAATSGADKFGATVVLEEGMKPEILQLTAEEAQYIDSRKLNREEVVAGYDLPPPAVHILDRATFSNITEQLRSIYRDTMAPITESHEAELELQLRGSVRPGASGPDFSDEVYAEFLLDGVLRGDFEQRAEAYQKAINSAWTTPAEVRKMENLPFIEGSDQLFINSTMVPVETDDDAADRAEARNIVEMVQKVYLGVGVVISADEARQMLNAAGAELGPMPEAPPTSATLDEATVRAVMGRLSRTKTLAELDRRMLVHDLNGHGKTVLQQVDAAVAAGENVEGLKDRIRDLAAPPTARDQLAEAVKMLAEKDHTPVVNNYLNVPEGRTEVLIAEGAVKVAQPDVTVNVPPAQVEVNLPAERSRRFVRDEHGDITGVVVESDE
jgi:HK97 family phage portal protein